MKNKIDLQWYLRMLIILSGFTILLRDYFFFLRYLAPADDPRRVVVEKMAFVVEGRDDIELDLTGWYIQENVF